MNKPYTYQSWDNRTISLEGLLDSYSKEEVARLAGVESRRQRLIAAMEACHKAGEHTIIGEVLARYNIKN